MTRTELAAIWPPTASAREAGHKPQSPLQAIREKCRNCSYDRLVRQACAMTERHCPGCGRLLVDVDVSLTLTQRQILGVLKRRGSASADELRDALWSDDPEGGPDNPSTLHAHIRHLNQRLKSRGLRVRASRWSGYRVIEIGDFR